MTRILDSKARITHLCSIQEIINVKPYPEVTLELILDREITFSDLAVALMGDGTKMVRVIIESIDSDYITEHADGGQAKDQ